MPSYKHTQPGGANKGNPTGKGQDKAAGKPVDPNQTRAGHEDLNKKYTEGPDETGANVQTNNPNRNTDKPDLDNNKYN
ncbi:lipoprotein [Pontibacter sp. HJ8]